MNKIKIFGAAFALGLAAWPVVEGYRYYEANHDLLARLELENKVTQKLALSKARNAQLAATQKPAEDAE